MYARYLTAVVAAAVGPGLFASPALAAKPAPPTLTGTTFSGTATTSCTGAAFSFTANGDVVSGAYTGDTFTESGSGTLAAPTAGPFETFSASFTIYDLSGKAIITGTKTLIYTGTNFGECQGSNSFAYASVSYSAQYGHHKKDTETGEANLAALPGNFDESFGTPVE